MFTCALVLTDVYDSRYAITAADDPLRPVCAAGADGDEAMAMQCFAGWNERKRGILAELNALREELRASFPATVPGVPTAYSGSYWNEAGTRIKGVSRGVNYQLFSLISVFTYCEIEYARVFCFVTFVLEKHWRMDYHLSLRVRFR